jgi:hypothetical protein
MKRTLFSMSVTVVGLLVFSNSSLANSFVVGHSSNGDVILNSADNWIVLRSATVNIPGADVAVHGCVATASADMQNVGGGEAENQYRFVLSRNNTNPTTNGGSERLLELVDNSGNDDPDSKPVSTTLHFTGLTNDNGASGAGAHTFYFLGRKVQAGDADAAVLDASLSVMCIDTP